ncbi:MAG: hypothetical protein ILP10_08945 [Lachnospiraceae bacterium]|nr:hypothetical protein [Lachnospiraceae bacterium]
MKKIISFALVLVLALTLAIPSGAQAAKKNKGPNEAGDSKAYVRVSDSQGINDYIYVSEAIPDYVATLVEGVSYDKKTNTLTLSGYNEPGNTIEANEMGSDFKIKLVGTNNIKCLSIAGNAYGGSCTITGKGTLNVNKTGERGEFGIILEAEDSDAVLTIDKNCKVNAWARRAGYAVRVVSSTVKKNIVIKGKTSAKTVTKKSDAPNRKDFWIYNINNRSKDEFEEFEIYKKGGKEFGINKYSNGAADVYKWVKVAGKWAYSFVERTEDVSDYKATGKKRKGASLTLVKTGFLKSGGAPVWSFFSYDTKTEKNTNNLAVGTLMGKASGIGKVYKISKTYKEDPGNLKLKLHAVYDSNVKGKSFSNKKK